VRTRQTFPTAKQRKASKYDYLVGTVVGTRKILSSLPRSLFEVECLVCNHISFQRGDTLLKLEHKECQKCKIDNRDPNLNTAFLRTRGNAKNRGIEFELSKTYYSKIASMNCYYCDSEPDQSASINFKERCTSYNGLDRKDPKLGYVEGNVVSSCKYCNYAKHDLSEKEFYEWVRKVYEQTISK
jgi:hypothetical protein